MPEPIHAFLEFFTNTPNNILSNPQATFPSNHHKKHKQQLETNDFHCNSFHQSLERLLAKPGNKQATSCSHVLYQA